MVGRTQHLLCVMQLCTVETENVHRILFHRRTEHDIIKRIHIFKVIRECDGTFFPQGCFHETSKFPHGFRKQFGAFFPDYVFLFLERSLKETVDITKNCFDNISIFISNHFLFHVEDRHIVDEVCVSHLIFEFLFLYSFELFQYSYALLLNHSYE